MQIDFDGNPAENDGNDGNPDGNPPQNDGKRDGNDGNFDGNPPKYLLQNPDSYDMIWAKNRCEGNTLKKKSRFKIRCEGNTLKRNPA